MGKEVTMGYFGRFAVRGVGGLFCGKTPQRTNATIDCYSGFPWVVLEPRLERHTLEAMPTRASSISTVLSVTRLPEIEYPVVRLAPVNVVDLIGRFRPIKNFPSEPVGRVVLTGDLNVDIPALVNSTGDTPRRRPSASFDPPKSTAFRVVTDNALDVFYVHAYSIPGPEWDCQGRSG